MNNIKDFGSSKITNVSTYLKHVAERIDDTSKSVCLAIKRTDGIWETAYFKATVNDKLEAISHIQFDAIRNMISENYIIPDE